MEELHKKHHYIPRSYLKNWQDSEKRISIYKILVDRSNIPLWKRVTVAAVAYQSHLYTRVVAGQENDQIEKWLDKDFEAPAEPVIQKVINDRRLSAEDWRILVRFLAAQDVRTPFRMLEHIKRFQDILPETLAEVMNNLPDKISKSISIKEIKNSNKNLFPLKITSKLVHGKSHGFIKAETYVGRASWIFSMKHFLENTIEVLHSHKWTIVSPAKGYNWITSDNPVVKLNFQNNDQYNLRGGWGVKNGNIFFPLGPKHAMFTQIGCYPAKRGTILNSALTMNLRRFSAENAYRMIFSNKFDPEVDQMRPRSIDSEYLKKEREIIASWHEKNSKREIEFYR